MKSLHKEHLVIVRTSGSIIDLSTYNCQELGLAKTLTKIGMNVSLIMAGMKTERINIDGVNVWYCEFISINQQLAWFKNIKRILDELHPTLIQVHEIGLLMSWVVVHWAKKNKIPSFLIQGNYQTTQKPIFRQLEFLYNKTFGKSVIKNVTGIGCKTFMASHYIQRYYRKATQLTYIGLDVSKFENCANKNFYDKDYYTDKKVLLYVGKIEPRRNPLFLINILSELPEDYVMIMVGGGLLEGTVRNLIKSYGLDKRCTLLGKIRQEQLVSIYNISDIFLLASDYEIYGMVLLEAMYFGVPVISTLTAGSEKLIQNGKNGYIINSLDIEKWVTQIKAVCENKNLHDDMKKYAEKTIKQKFLWSEAANNFLSLYGLDK